jgi:hypothetical protein
MGGRGHLRPTVTRDETKQRYTPKTMPEDDSLVIPNSQIFSDSILPQNKDELAKFMDQPFPAIAEIIMGALANGLKGWPLVAGRIVQGAFKGQMFQQVNRTIKEFRQKGKLPEDFTEQPMGAKTWTELFQIIDEETPDEVRLDAIMAMFMAVNKPNKGNQEKIIDYQLFQAAKRLNSGELFLLKKLYDLYKVSWQATPTYGTPVIVEEWAELVAKKIGHNLSNLVVRDERKLVAEGLLSNYVSSSDSLPHQAQVKTENARLTPLGIRFCGLIEEYRKDLT